MTEEQLAAVRLYTSKEVVEALGLKPTWLKRWITDGRVPHVRAGAKRGLRFTAAHVLEIGKMLPDLLGGQRGGWMAVEPRPAVVDESVAGVVAQGPAPLVIDIASWSQMRAHRSRPRST